MSIIDLIQAAGVENVMVQRIDESSPTVQTVGKQESRVTFYTGRQYIQPHDLLWPEDTNWTGYIVWVPRQKLSTDANPASPEMEARNAGAKPSNVSLGASADS